jgi:hypothetical protein
LKKTHHKKGLVAWLKVEALSSNPSTSKKRKVNYFNPEGISLWWLDLQPIFWHSVS